MVHWLNKAYALLLAALIFSGGPSFSQNNTETPDYEDYKDPAQFEKFNKRRKLICAWQINELKTGALVVRLKTNKLLIDNLLKQGNTALAREKELELFAINKNTMFAYKDNFNFCKLYFIYSNCSDSLLNGARSGIFIDTNLVVNPAIVMNEDFYLLAERDFAYNSSIGFVKEDSARLTVERGNPVKEMAITIKNKYGHQLKGPFPYYVKEKTFVDAAYDFPVTVTPLPGGGTYISYVVNKTYLQDQKNKKTTATRKPHETGTTMVKVKQQFTYEKLSLAVEELNENLRQFFLGNPKPDKKVLSPTIKPFLY